MRLSLDDFFALVSTREGVDLPEAVQHMRAVFSVLSEAVSQGEIDQVRAQLPREYHGLFAEGSKGTMPRG